MVRDKGGESLQVAKNERNWLLASAMVEIYSEKDAWFAVL